VEQIAEYVQQAFKLNLNSLTWIDASEQDDLIKKVRIKSNTKTNTLWRQGCYSRTQSNYR